MSKTVIMNTDQLQDAIISLTNQIIAGHEDLANIAIIGIRERGDILARRMIQHIKIQTKKEPLFGILDINFYRDDIKTHVQKQVIGQTNIPFDITDKTIILVDDVLFTGRSIRAALDALIDFGRPRRIQLAVVIDRGGREFPIQPDFVAQTITADLSDTVVVHVMETDHCDNIIMIRK